MKWDRVIYIDEDGVLIDPLQLKAKPIIIKTYKKTYKNENELRCETINIIKIRTKDGCSQNLF